MQAASLNTSVLVPNRAFAILLVVLLFITFRFLIFVAVRSARRRRFRSGDRRRDFVEHQEGRRGCVGRGGRVRAFTFTVAIAGRRLFAGFVFFSEVDGAPRARCAECDRIRRGLKPKIKFASAPTRETASLAFSYPWKLFLFACCSSVLFTACRLPRMPPRISTFDICSLVFFWKL